MTLTEERLNIKGQNLYYQKLSPPVKSDDFALILLHDSWGCVDLWGDFPAEMAELFNCDVIAYDRLGYGKSNAHTSESYNMANYHRKAAEELHSFMDILKVDQAVLYGHSDGATIALLAAAFFPDRIKAVIAETPHTFIEEEGRMAVRKTLEKSKSNSLLKSLSKYHGDKTALLFERWHQIWLSSEYDEWDVRPLFSKIECPVLAMRGEQDPFDTNQQLYSLEGYIQSPLCMALIPKAGHTPRRETPDESVKKIVEFKKTHL